MCVMVFQDAFNPSLLAEVRLEIINNIEATYKETDLFKVFQTGRPLSSCLLMPPHPLMTHKVLWRGSTHKDF